MLRLASSLLTAVIVMTAALLPGAAVFASPGVPADCVEFAPPNQSTVKEFPLIVVGTVESVDSHAAHIRPETILKGSAAGASLALPNPGIVGFCGNAVLEPGERLLLFLRVNGGVAEWPTVDQTYYLQNGMAESANPTAETLFREQELVDLVRAQTDQVVVPAASEDEGQGIEWRSTVLPILVALGVIFVIGLFLMRIWHRIDPS